MSLRNKKKVEESDVVKHLIKVFPGSAKLTASGVFKARGIADIALNVDGITVFVEVKLNDGKVTELQRKFLERWRYGYVIRYFPKHDRWHVETAGKWKPTDNKFLNWLDELAPVTGAKIKDRIIRHG